MAGAADEVALLTEANKLLGARVQELESIMAGGRSAAEVELEAQLAQVGRYLPTSTCTVPWQWQRATATDLPTFGKQRCSEH
jgi:hypothetical protein